MSPAVAGLHAAAEDRSAPRTVAAQPERQDRSKGPRRRVRFVVRRAGLKSVWRTANGPPAHRTPPHWQAVDGCLVVGGGPLTRLAERFGRTPFYAYDRRLLDARVAELRQHLPRAVKLHYAIKANPMPALVCH